MGPIATFWHERDDGPFDTGWYFVYAPDYVPTKNGREAFNGFTFSKYTMLKDRTGYWSCERTHPRNKDVVKLWAYTSMPIEIINTYKQLDENYFKKKQK